MNKLETVKEIMKYIEDLISLGDYQCFEVALLLAERSSFTHEEITEQLINEVSSVVDCRDTLFDIDLNYDLEDVFSNYEHLISNEEISEPDF